MAMTCTIWNGPNNEAIDKALLAGTPFRHIASQFGTNTGALQRHKKEHLPEALIKAKEVQAIAHGDALLAEIQDLDRHTRRIPTKAENANKLETALKPIGTILQNCELRAKLHRQMGKQNPPSKHLHLHGVPEEVLRRLAHRQDDDGGGIVVTSGPR